ncbi:MAG TPA: hypothetical protein VG276_26480 [Actinomycetes bacterium]|nr:hypothetical protein [Actinomycetes bacterium]
MSARLVEAVLAGPCSTVADRRTYDRHARGGWVLRTTVRYCDACGHLGPGAHHCPAPAGPGRPR